MSFITSRARRVLLLVFVTLIAGSVLPMPMAGAAQPQTELQRLLTIARDQAGARYSFSATGPNSFDCSGFVYYAFREAGLLDRIGGKRRTVAGYRKWFANNGTITKGIASARPGDVLIWGRNKHTGIYLGNGYAISALVNPYGVKVHKYNWINHRLTVVLRVNLER